jgi:ADP-ribosylglycohydrolase
VIAHHQALCDLIRGGAKADIERNIKPVRDMMIHRDIKPDGYAPNTLICAADAIRDTDNFEDALVRAVNLGGDADTIGAVTGGLAGALYGTKNIPKRWTDCLEKKLVRQIENLAKTARDAQ